MPRSLSASASSTSATRVISFAPWSKAMAAVVNARKTSMMMAAPVASRASRTRLPTRISMSCPRCVIFWWGVAGRMQSRSTEPPRVLRRLIRLSHAAITGLENRVSKIGSASATPGRANLRWKVAFVFVRPARCRHGFARSRHALTATAFGLITTRPPRRRRSSSESQRERAIGTAIVCGMGRSRATTELDPGGWTGIVT